MKEQIRLYLIEATGNRVDQLTTELAPLPQVSVLGNYADALAVSGGLDAIFVPLMSALEWGLIRPPAPLHQTCVVKMPDCEVARGRPEYAIPGIATDPREILGPMDRTRLVLRESFRALYHFNQTSSRKLVKVGAGSIILGLDKLRVGDALILLSEVYAVGVD